MSVNLTLVFNTFDLVGGPVLAFTRMKLKYQNYLLFSAIESEAVPFPSGVNWYDDDGIRCTFDDPYGKPLTCITAYGLKRLLATVPLTGWDIAIVAFISALPPTSLIILWWS